jgi:hypothetical protein
VTGARTSLAAGTWTIQPARNPLMDLHDRAGAFQFLFRDRAGQLTTSFNSPPPSTHHLLQLTTSFNEVMAGAGIATV